MAELIDDDGLPVPPPPQAYRGGAIPIEQQYDSEDDSDLEEQRRRDRGGSHSDDEYPNPDSEPPPPPRQAGQRISSSAPAAAGPLSSALRSNAQLNSIGERIFDSEDEDECGEANAPSTPGGGPTTPSSNSTSSVGRVAPPPIPAGLGSGSSPSLSGKTLSSSGPPASDIRWECEKSNRFGLKETRVLVLSSAAHAIRFFDLKSNKLKAEIPLTQISSTRRRANGEDSRRVEMVFREERRAYELWFKTEEEAANFEKMCSSAVEGHIQAVAQRAHSQSVARGAIMMPPSAVSSSSPSAGHPAASAAAHSHSHHAHSQSAVLPPSAGANHHHNHHGHARHGDSISGMPGGISSSNSRQSVATRSEVAYSDASDPAAIAAAAAAAAATAPTAAGNEDNDYLDYPVFKKNKFGMKQARILVLSSSGGGVAAGSTTAAAVGSGGDPRMMLLDEKRKFKKEFSLQSIMEVEIPKNASVAAGKSAPAGEAQAYLIFNKESAQKPFHLFFADTLDRLHFCERLVSLAPHQLAVKDENEGSDLSSSSGSAPASVRFGVLKLNKVGVKKKRVVELRSGDRVLRSFDDEKSYKDTHFTKIRRWEKLLLDRAKLHVFLSERPHPLVLVFTDTVARERFVCECNYIRQLMDEEALAALPPPPAAAAVPAPATPTATPPPTTGFGGIGVPGPGTPSAGRSGQFSAAAAASRPISVSAIPAPRPAVRSTNPPLSIFIGTWNLGNAPCQPDPVALAEFVPANAYDVYVLALQECSKGSREQWLFELRAAVQGGAAAAQQQHTAGQSTAAAGANAAAGASTAASGASSSNSSGGSGAPSTPTAGGSAASSSSHHHHAKGSLSVSSLEEDRLAPAAADASEEHAPYALLGVVKLWEMVMMVLIRRPLVNRVSNICMDTIATGVGDVLGNKGGIGLSFNFRDTSLAFVGCHLAARSERVAQRAENYQKILRQLQLGSPGIDLLAQMDHVFWLGDLNYRNEGLEFSEVLQLVKMKDFALLKKYDQLLAQKESGLVFPLFNEGPLKFAPTYRWERKENTFSNKKFQLPSWTDRVLWHSAQRSVADLQIDAYGSAPNCFCSDHRPVFASFTLQPRAGYTGRLPLPPPASQPDAVPRPAAPLAAAAANPSPGSIGIKLQNGNTPTPIATKANGFISPLAANPNSTAAAQISATAAATSTSASASSSSAPSTPSSASSSTAAAAVGATPLPQRHFQSMSGQHPPRLSPSSASSSASASSSSSSSTTSSVSSTGTGATTSVAALRAQMAVNLAVGSLPGSSGGGGGLVGSPSEKPEKKPYQHFSLPGQSPLAMASGGGGAGGSGGFGGPSQSARTSFASPSALGLLPPPSATTAAAATAAEKTKAVDGSATGGKSSGGQIFPFTPPALGSLFLPPVPSPAQRAARPMVPVGSSKDFSIILSSVRVTLAAPPRGDMTLTPSAPFLASWAPSPPCSYAFGAEAGCHWHELVLNPFIHDPYYLFSRAVTLVLGVPSDTSSASQVNLEQTGPGSQLGTSTVSLGTVCANIFQQLASIPSSALSTASAAPFAALPRTGSDAGAYVFIEPIYRDGLVVGQIEGTAAFRFSGVISPTSAAAAKKQPPPR